jgi:hypothetical protein
MGYPYQGRIHRAATFESPIVEVAANCVATR